MSYVPPSAPLSVGGVLDDWLRIFRSSFNRCWQLALIASVAGALLEFLIAPTLPPTGTEKLQYYLQIWAAMSGPQGFLAQLPFWIVIGIVYGALLAQQSAVIRGDASFSNGKALAMGLNRLPQMILGMILLVLIMFAVALPVGIIAAIAIGVYGSHSLAGASPLIIAAGLGALLTVFGFIYLGVRLQVWPAAIFADDYGGAGALGRSWQLVRGHWWRVAAVGFVAGVVVWILGLAVQGSLMLFTGVFTTHITDVPDVLRRIRTAAIITQLARLVTMPLLSAIWLAIYHDLRLRREGGDLAARAEALGTP